MKRFSFLFFLFLFLNVWSQAKHFEISWQLKDLQSSIPIKPDAYQLFQSENYQYHQDNIYFADTWKDGQNIDPENYQILNVKYSPIAQNLVKKLKFKTFSDQFIPKLASHIARNDIFTSLLINTIIKKGSQYYKLESFDIKYAYKPIANRHLSQNIYDSRWATGKWYRFKISKSGVYKINKDFLKSLGIAIDNIDPRKLKIFGNSGKVMPLSNAVYYPEDISELAIEIVGEQDGQFDADDYILFYAQSDKEWSDDYDANLNIYTNDTYYFIQIDDQNGKRIQAYNEPAGNPIEIYSTYQSRQFYEEDHTIFTHMGRKVFDAPFDGINNQKSFEFDFPNRVETEPVTYQIKAATDKAPTSLMINLNNQNLGQINFSIFGYDIATDNSLQGSRIITGNPLKFDVTYNSNNLFDAHLYMEYVNVQAYCQLKQSGKQFRFYHPQADSGSGIAAYQFSQATDITRVWDITDIYNPTYISNSQSNFEVKFNKADRKRFIAIDKNDFFTPEKVENSLQSNQNLHKDVFYHTGQFKDLDYLIVTPAFLHPKAEAFAEMHRANAINVYVADLQKIYNEFGNAQQDIAAIRNFIKYIYFNASAPDKCLKYVMLFGDASNDFKNVLPDNVLEGVRSNIVPIYESLNAFNLVTSIGTDDFFVMMDPNEGTISSSNEKPDIAVGRLLVRNNEEADVLYQKYQTYLSPKTKQNWRTFVTLWSDDADPGHTGDISFVQNTEAIAQNIQQTHPEINISKIYQDAYLQINTPGGPRYPDAKRDLFNQFEKGTLILGYIGHGNQVALSHERMLTMEDIPKLHNAERLPLMTTMTCEFARFDDATRETAAEHLLWHKDGGVLEMVSTIREIWTSNAKIMNTEFFNTLFGVHQNGQIIKNPAEALRIAKVNTNTGIGKYNIAFLGDPCFDLGFAEPKIVLNSVNNIPTDTLKALKHIIIKGEIQDALGNLLPQYKGQLYPIVFDKYQSDEVLDNDNNDYQFSFEKLGKKIFQGKTDITNGQFTFDFIVPKDIDLNYGKGRLSFYAVNDHEEKIGYDESIIVGGVDPNAEADSKPPIIKAYLNDHNFVSGNITDANPYLLLDLEDEHGINTIGGIGHDITAYLDDNQTEMFVLNDFYETENNTYQKGQVKYRLYNIEPGWHTLHIKAWDVYNNSSETTIDFQVVENTELKLEHVLNYPNPFVNYTEFWFNHNHPFENLDVLIQVYTISGKVVWQQRQNIVNDGFLSRDISWDGRDNFGNKLAKGVYLYKVNVRTATGKKAQKIEKLVIL